jgi:hypothetical protein
MHGHRWWQGTYFLSTQRWCSVSLICDSYATFVLFFVLFDVIFCMISTVHTFDQLVTNSVDEGNCFGFETYANTNTLFTFFLLCQSLRFWDNACINTDFVISTRYACINSYIITFATTCVFITFFNCKFWIWHPQRQGLIRSNAKK